MKNKLISMVVLVLVMGKGSINGAIYDGGVIVGTKGCSKDCTNMKWGGSMSSKLDGYNFSGVKFGGTNGCKVGDLVNLGGFVFTNCNFTGADCSGVCFYDTIFDNCTFTRTNFKGATLKGTKFIFCVGLSKENRRNAHDHGAKFVGC